jgi:hypothetical protein
VGTPVRAPVERRANARAAARRLPNPLPCAPEHARRLAAHGVDVLGLALDSWSVERARAVGWVAGLRTRPRRKRNADGELVDGSEGIDRGLRVAMCGRLMLARETQPDGRTDWGLAHDRCRDRGCPRCMATLQRNRAARLRDFAAPHMAACLFVTLTQPKLPIEDERAGEAADRVLGRDRDGVDTGHGYRALWRGSSGRFMRLFFQGGVRALEVVLAKAGTVRRDGTVVEVTGWHAHIHQLLQVTTPDGDACAKAWRWVRRRLRSLDGDERASARDEVRRLESIGRSLHKLTPRIVAGEAVPNEWRELARRVVLARWLAVCVGAKASAQDVQAADADRVGQVTKYVTKPFELRDGRRARELFIALESRHAIRSWGTWRSWAAELDEDADEEEGARIEVSRTPLRALFACIDSAQRSFLDEQLTIDFRTYEVSAKATRVLADVERLGGTFSARDRRMAWDDERGKLREAVRRAAGKLRLNAVGLFTNDAPAESWRPPPYALRDVFERRAAQVEESYRIALQLQAELADERRAIRLELQRAGREASDADVELELCARNSAELVARRRRRPPAEVVEVLADRVRALDELLVEDRPGPSFYGSRDELVELRRELARELDECRAILRARDAPREPDAFEDAIAWDVARGFDDLHRIAPRWDVDLRTPAARDAGA